MEDLRSLLYRLKEQHTLTKEEWTALIAGRTPQLARELFSLARQEQQRWYGHDIYIRGLIEFTNYCRNDCLYCGIRRSNPHAAATGSPWNRSWTAAVGATSWDFAPLCSRAVRTAGSQTSG